ncbi:hypothetical protein L218DRAFT_949002 [Marasmius fiardii PR-910]|nr:hypothetical protein L218DRAFT_949002 [Marasmius fiardii PR-910]
MSSKYCVVLEDVVSPWLLVDSDSTLDTRGTSISDGSTNCVPGVILCEIDPGLFDTTACNLISAGVTVVVDKEESGRRPDTFPEPVYTGIQEGPAVAFDGGASEVAAPCWDLVVAVDIISAGLDEVKASPTIEKGGAHRYALLAQTQVNLTRDYISPRGSYKPSPIYLKTPTASINLYGQVIDYRYILIVP